MKREIKFRAHSNRERSGVDFWELIRPHESK